MLLRAAARIGLRAPFLPATTATGGGCQRMAVSAWSTAVRRPQGGAVPGLSARLRCWRPRRQPLSTGAATPPAAQTFAQKAQLDRATWVGLGWLGAFTLAYYGVPADAKTAATVKLVAAMRGAGLSTTMVSNAPPTARAQPI